MQDGSRVRLEFFGHTYYLTQKSSDDVDLKDLVAYVERSAQKVVIEHSKLPAHKQIVLTILSIARDYFQAKGELDGLQKRLENILSMIATE